MDKRFLQVSNILAHIFALVMNGLVGAQVLNVRSIGAVSDQFASFLTPATYAFSIWSLIYVLLTVFVIYQARDLFSPSKNNDLPQRIGLFFIIASIANGLWTYIFVSGMIGLSVGVLLTLTAALYALFPRLKIATYDASPRTIFFVWWPITIYTGWVTVATVVNIASYFASVGLDITAPIAAGVIISLSVLLAVLLLARNVRELIAVSAWGIVAIGVRQIQLDDGSMLVAYSALASSGVLILLAGYHGYLNRKTFPFRNR